jgi:hypothetical protein
MKRSKAADLIDAIRVIVARSEAQELVADTAAELVAIELAEFGLTPLEPCGGEAHSNAHIDNCSLCAPRWGFVGKKEPVT